MEALAVGQVPEIDRGQHQVLDARVERGQRVVAIEHRDDLAVFVGLGRQMTVDARQCAGHGIVLRVTEVVAAFLRPVKPGRPWQQRARNRRLHRLVFARRRLAVGVHHQGVEPAVFADGGVERLPAALDQQAAARQPGGVAVGRQCPPFEVEYRGQPLVGRHHARLHQHADQVAVEHQHVLRHQGRRRGLQQLVELVKLGVGQVLFHAPIVGPAETAPSARVQPARRA